MKQVIHLIGSQVSGKSHLIRELKKKNSDINVFCLAEDFYKKHGVLSSTYNMDWDKYRIHYTKIPGEVKKFIDGARIPIIESSGLNDTLQFVLADYQVFEIAMEPPNDYDLEWRCKERNIDIKVAKDIRRQFINLQLPTLDYDEALERMEEAIDRVRTSNKPTTPVIKISVDAILSHRKVLAETDWKSDEFWKMPVNMSYDPWDVDGREYFFDKASAIRVIEFWESTFIHSSAEWQGKPFILEPFQKQIVGHFFGWKQVKGTPDTQGGPDIHLRRFREMFIYIPRKNGKAVDVETPIATSKGWKRMADIKEGDLVFDENGIPTTVIHATDFQYNRNCFEVLFSDGNSLVVDEEHLWKADKRSDWRKEPQTLFTTGEMLQDYRTGKKQEANYSIDLCKPVQYAEKSLPIDPYTFGAWVGDGDSDSPRITCTDKNLSIIRRIEKAGYVTTKICTKDRTPRYSITHPEGKAKSLIHDLRRMKVLGNKSIPKKYLQGSIIQRKELLKGLMDTDGYCSTSGQCEFTTTNPKIATGFMELIQSLGFKASEKVDYARLNGGIYGFKYRIQFWAYSDNPVFHMERKKSRQKDNPGKKTRTSNRKIVKITPVPSRPVKCIAVDSPNNLYCAGNSFIPTHNTPLGVCIALIMYRFDGELGAEVDIMAADKQQAGIAWGDLSYNIENVPIFKADKMFKDHPDHINLFKSQQVVEWAATASYARVLSADADTKHGYRPSCYLIDELHLQKNEELMDTMETGTAARREPAAIYITTADYDHPSPCNEKLTYAEAVIVDPKADPEFFPCVYRADDDDDPTDEGTWMKANPNYGVSCKPEYFRKKARKAAKYPRFMNAFKRLHLNIKTGQTVRWLSKDMFKQCSNPIPIEKLKGQACYGAIDLASQYDLCSFSLFFPDYMYFMHHFWVPEQRIAERLEYQVWEAMGMLNGTKGKTTDYNFIKAEVVKCAEMFNILDIAYDNYNASHFVMDLSEYDSIEMVRFGQTMKFFNEPSKRYEEYIENQLIQHDGNEVAIWMSGNVEVKEDPDGNIKPIKPPRGGSAKVDGIVTDVMAIGVWLNDDLENRLLNPVISGGDEEEEKESEDGSDATTFEEIVDDDDMWN